MVGSTACAMTMVACGRADAYFGAGFHIWDIVAAEIVLTEAGGVTTSLQGMSLYVTFPLKFVTKTVTNSCLTKIVSTRVPLNLKTKINLNLRK